MKKICHMIVILIISYMICFLVASSYIFSSTSTCLAAEKITPYKPQVRYSEPYGAIKTETGQEIKAAKKRKLWPWIAGGLVVVAGALALAAGGGGGDEGGSSTGGGGGNGSSSDTVDVNVSW